MSAATWLLDLNRKVDRLEYAVDAAENVHGGGKDCPEFEGYCQLCNEKFIAVYDRIQELPWIIRAAMWFRSPLNTWRTYREVESARAAMATRAARGTYANPA